MNLAHTSRTIERHLLASLLGALLAVVLVRVILLFFELHPIGLAGVLLIGAWSGVCVSYFSQRSEDLLVESLRSWTPQLRAMCLKVLLWLLGAATVIGVLTVLTASYDTLGRVAGTVFATAIAAGILWPLSLMIDRPRTLAAGLFGTTATVVVYCLAIPLIWEFDSQSEEIFFTTLVIGLTAPVGMVVLMMASIPKVEFAGRLGTVLYVLVFAIFCIAIWHPGDWRSRNEWWTCGWWLATYGAISVACLSGWTVSKLRHWRLLGVIASAAAWWLIMLHEWGSYPLFEKAITLLTSSAVVLGHISLTQFVSLFPGQRWLRTATSVAMAITAVFLNLELLIFPDSGISMLGRVAGAAGVVASCGTLALLVLARLNRRGHSTVDKGEITEVTVYCPDCGKKQSLAIGIAECSRCGLTIQIVVTRK